MRIQVSEATALLLQDKNFILVEWKSRVKPKGFMKTFWVDGKKPSSSTTRSASLTVNRTPPIITGIHPNKGSTTPTTSVPRRRSPAPDEWPQAELRLGDHYLRVHCSHTLPSIDPGLLQSELHTLCPFSNTSMNSEGNMSGIMPLSPLPESLHSPPSSLVPSSPQQETDNKSRQW